MKYLDIINKMTLEDKTKLCVGKDYWHSLNIDELGIPSITMSDGPNGLRIQKEKGDNLGVNKSEVSICFPSGSTLANSWDKDLAYLYGKTLGEEAKCENINIVLGPAMNIKRNPLCGRNFEYFSEDPYLTSIMASQYVKGLQENNVGASLKHFAVNNQENRRRTIDVLIDERTLREIYLKAFEYTVKNSDPWSIMTSYNKVNGKYASENKILLDILKKEWNFEGITITDWGANNQRVDGLIAGNELEMPGGRGNGVEEIIEAVKNQQITEEYLNQIVERILNIAFKCAERKLEQYDKEEHHKIAQTIAEESIVLLKNENNLLPLQNTQNIAVIGDMAKTPRYQGAGSSTINPYKLDNAYDSLLSENITFKYAQGYERIESENDKALLKEAEELAQTSDIVLLFVGLTENYESEGMDRATMNLPQNQIKLIESISSLNKNTIIVLSHGSSIAMPWSNKVPAIITGYLGGEASGKAIINAILGKVNPSGKLAETYPIKYEDVSSYNNFPGNEVNVSYKESIYIGYRYFDKAKIPVQYPFGYGLSYTQFEYSNLTTTQTNNETTISFNIKNTGKYAGKEIAQVYISKPNSKIFRAEKELKAFEKVHLNPNEEKTITITLNNKAFEYYDTNLNKWNIEDGTYTILIGKSSVEIVLSTTINIKGDKNIIKSNISPKYYTGDVKEITDSEFEQLLGYKTPSKTINLNEFNDENTIEQLKHTKIGKVIFEHEMKRMEELLSKQNVNKATKVMMDLQKPLKKFYEKKSSKITKEMVDEFIEIAKNNADFTNNKFVDEYLK